MLGFFLNFLVVVYKKMIMLFLGYIFNVEWYVYLIYISIKFGKNKF